MTVYVMIPQIGKFTDQGSSIVPNHNMTMQLIQGILRRNG